MEPTNLNMKVADAAARADARMRSIRASLPRLRTVALAIVVGIVVFLGFRLFWFMTDDAFIAFRYVSNHRLGRGFVWNPPPFLPVEGYTGWLWVVLLRAVW